MKYLKLMYVFVVMLSACVVSPLQAMPEGAEAVKNFSVDKYLGTWYEIARLDHRFERNLFNVTASYSLNDDGSLKVLNRGFNTKKDRWSDAEGKAVFIGDKTVGRLKVTFFWPFYGAYNIIALEPENYEYALVIGNNLKYMWILARKPALEPEVLERLLNQARELGFATDELIYPQIDEGKGAQQP